MPHHFCISGQIISVETVRCRDLDPDNIYVTGHVKPNNCFWKEYPDSKKRFALCIRVYALFGQGMEGYESIGMYTNLYADTKKLFRDSFYVFKKKGYMYCYVCSAKSADTQCIKNLRDNVMDDSILKEGYVVHL